MSFDWLTKATTDGAEFDFIYVDGAHEKKDVLRDLIMAWPLLKSGRLMLIDDYLGGEGVRIAADAFMAVFDGDFTIELSNYQVCLRKV